MSEADRLARCRRAFAGDYRIDRLVGDRDGILVLLAHDLALDRPVVIEVLIPGDQPPRRPPSFLREARLLARLSHPNIVPVHRAGVQDGLWYVVLAHLQGESLDTRLAHGPLPVAAFLQLGRDLLRALEAAHGQGIVHRNISPAAILCLEGRYLLTEFGLARLDDGTSSMPSSGGRLSWSTGFLSPEQAAGTEATPLSDLYSAGCVLYQALAGRPWIGADREVRRPWKGVPFRFRAALRRALSPLPEDRWPDAASFRRALEGGRRGRRRAVIAGAVLLAIVGGAGLLLYPPADRHSLPGGPSRQLAILPLEGGGPAGDSLGNGLAHLLQLDLDNLPGLDLTSQRQIVRWSERQGGDVLGGRPAAAARALNAHWVTHGLLERRGDSLQVRLTLYDSLGNKTPIPVSSGVVADLAALGDTVALRLVRAVAPDLEKYYGPVRDLAGVPLGPLKAFLQGEAAFQRDAWALAERNYEVAIRADSTFALAEWRLANVKRWRRLPLDLDLQTLYRRLGARLRPNDRLVLEALLETDLRRRLAALEAAVNRYPSDAYTRLLLGEELYHRGPLVGRGIEQGVTVMSEAIRLDSSLAQAYDHVIYAAIRSGNRAEARRMLDLRRRVSLRPSPGDIDVVPLFELAFDGRFVPWRGRLKETYLRWRADSAHLSGVRRVSRIGVPWFDIPRTQLALSDLVLRRGPPEDSVRASAVAGKGLAFFALGQLARALGQFDSAAAMLITADAGLQRAEWRVFPPAMGFPPSLPVANDPWVRELVALTEDPALSRRALWALAVERLSAGDTAGAEAWRARLEAGTSPHDPLARFLRALQEAGRGRFEAALAVSDSLRPEFEVTYPPDPFAGALFHLSRGTWRLALGDSLGADREWQWYEASDFDGWPSGMPHPGEIDGALAGYARWRRGDLRLATARTRADTAASCRLLRRVADLWRHADPALDSLLAAVRARAEVCPR